MRTGRFTLVPTKEGRPSDLPQWAREELVQGRLRIDRLETKMLLIDSERTELRGRLPEEVWVPIMEAWRP